MTSTRRLDGTVGVQSIAERRRTVERRRAALQNLQRLTIQLEAASTLAEGSPPAPKWHAGGTNRTTCRREEAALNERRGYDLRFCGGGAEGS